MTIPPLMSTEDAQPDRQLDETALARLRELDPDGRQGVVVRVLGAFESSLQRQLAQLQDPAVAAEGARVGGIAHLLKSSAASCGARGLAAVCAAVETRLRLDPALPPGPEAERIAFAADHALRAVVAARGALTPSR